VERSRLQEGIPVAPTSRADSDGQLGGQWRGSISSEQSNSLHNLWEISLLLRWLKLHFHGRTWMRVVLLFYELLSTWMLLFMEDNSIWW
jgi:hypothetical protein